MGKINMAGKRRQLARSILIPCFFGILLFLTRVLSDHQNVRVAAHVRGGPTAHNLDAVVDLYIISFHGNTLQAVQINSLKGHPHPTVEDGQATGHRESERDHEK